jgi:TolA-binding protein
MNRYRTSTTVCCLLGTAFLALGQTPAPKAVPAARPLAAPAPTPAPAPAPMDIDLGDLDLGDLDMQMSMLKELTMEFNPELQEKTEALKGQADRMRLDAEEQVAKALAKGSDFYDKMDAVKEKVARLNLDLAFAGQVTAPLPPTPPMPPVPPVRVRVYRGMGEDQLYSSGQRALDNRKWDEALECFSLVISRNSARTDGALYWKAYALGKLGRRDEAAAALAELRKNYAGSRWLDDAKALELELKQASGQNVAPEEESGEELKLMAINGLMKSDPERAIPLLESQLKGSASPRVKRNTLFVLAQSNSPKAQALLEQIARGGGNPDLQLKAIGYLDQRRKPNNNAQVLAEIYAATNDVAVKRAILLSHASIRDKDFLLHAARTEKSPELREVAISALAGNNATPELWQLYQAETTTEGKLKLLRYMYSNSNAGNLVEVVRTEKDPNVRASAMRVLVSQRSGVAADTLVSLYRAEPESQVKQSILDGLCAQGNAKALVEVARGEKDTKMKLRIVERLSSMKSKEASDYLEELLKK